MKNVAFGASLLAGLLCAGPVLAQRNDNPNMKMFYMARQQIQITDDAPAVNDMRTVVQPGQQAPAIPSPGQGLPRAGFASNMGAYHGGGGGSGLPTVNNGVPAKLPQAPTGGRVQNGMKAGNAGKLKAKAAPAANSGQAPAVKAYKPYATAPVAQTQSIPNGSLLNSSQNVRGSVLHWNKHH